MILLINSNSYVCSFQEIKYTREINLVCQRFILDRDHISKFTNAMIWVCYLSLLCKSMKTNFSHFGLSKSVLFTFQNEMLWELFARLLWRYANYCMSRINSVSLFSHTSRLELHACKRGARAPRFSFSDAKKIPKMENCWVLWSAKCFIENIIGIKCQFRTTRISKTPLYRYYSRLT
jgi:hypothetical protein